jgi:poly(hydroxyalkanoate) depolymerase family esterase
MGRAAVPVPQGARFETRSHACAAGARDYRLYVPASLAGAPRGLVLMLHGCTQDPDDFALGTGMNAQAERHGLIVAYPAQTRGHNASACWNWFDPAHQGREAGEPAILAGIAAALAAEFDVPREAVFAAGLSAGGAMAAVLAATHADLFSAVGIHSGLPYGAARDVASAFAAMRSGGAAKAAAGPSARLMVLHGTEDATVAPANAEAIAEAARRSLPPAKPRLRRCRAGGRDCTVRRVLRDGRPAVELWMIEGAGHAWSGGDPAGSYADAAGPDASAEMVRFFLDALGTRGR